MNLPEENHIVYPRDPEEKARRQGYFERLRRKLRWQLFVAYVTPLILLSVYFHFQYQDTLQKGIENHLRSAAENQRNTVELFIQERVANVKSAFRSLQLSDDRSSGAMRVLLAELRNESPTFVDVGLFDSQGILVDYCDYEDRYHDLLRGKDYGSEEWYTTLLRKRREYFISDVYLGFRKKPHFIIAVRSVIDGKPWVLRASVDPERFGRFVGKSHLAEDAETFIVNGKGQRQTISGEDGVGEVSAFVPGAHNSETQVAEVRTGDKEYLCAYAWLTETHWALVVSVPAANAYAPIRRARLILTAIMLLALVLIVLFVVGNTRRLVTNLESSYAEKDDLTRQLFNAAKLASVGEMAAGIAHEINNPLAIIYEEAELMKDILDPQFGQRVDLDEFKERFDAIAGAALRGRAITGKLLAFARRHDYVRTESDIRPLVEKIVAMKESEFKVSNIEVVKEFSEKLPKVLLNANEFEQVLLNLLNNARDAMNGRGRITLRMRSRGQHVQLDVEDTGCGMSGEQMERVFFPFYTTKEIGKGTGLGLSISYGIVKSLGGRIDVTSSVGAGTTFTITLPAALNSQPGNDDGGGNVG